MKMTKMKQNYMANIIMKYQEQFVNFPGKQGLAIKSSKQRIELFGLLLNGAAAQHGTAAQHDAAISGRSRGFLFFFLCNLKKI